MCSDSSYLLLFHPFSSSSDFDLIWIEVGDYPNFRYSNLEMHNHTTKVVILQSKWKIQRYFFASFTLKFS